MWFLLFMWSVVESRSKIVLLVVFAESCVSSLPINPLVSKRIRVSLLVVSVSLF